MRARTGSRRAFPHLLGHHDAETAYRQLRDRKSYPRLLATAIICVLLVQVAYLESINWTNSGTATVLQSLNLLFVLGSYACAGGDCPAYGKASAWRSPSREPC